MLVVEIKRIVVAEQPPRDAVARNSDPTQIAGEMHGTADHAVLERNGGWRVGNKTALGGVAYPDPPVNDVTITQYFLGADDKRRGSVGGQPAVDRRAARKQYPAAVHLYATRNICSGEPANIAGVDNYTAGDLSRQRSGSRRKRRSGVAFGCCQCPVAGNSQRQSHDAE